MTVVFAGVHEQCTPVKRVRRHVVDVEEVKEGGKDLEGDRG